jgi:hypothetical protein
MGRLRPAWMGELKERVSGLLPAEACCLPQRSLFQLPHPSRFESSTYNYMSQVSQFHDIVKEGRGSQI